MRWLPRGRSKEEELDDEILAHLAIEAERRIAAGETPEEAERSARRELGNVGMVKEVTRAMWRFAAFAAFGQDFKYAGRGMRLTPGFHSPQGHSRSQHGTTQGNREKPRYIDRCGTPPV